MNKDIVENNILSQSETSIKESTQQNLTRRRFMQLSAAVAGATQFGLSHLVYAGENMAPEVKGAKLGFIALSDAVPLFVAKEKGLFAKYGVPDVEVVKQSSWGTTRDNLVLGGEKNGIDGAHILTPMPYLISTGKVTTNNIPVPMSILARLNLDGQGISVSKEYASLKVGLDTSIFKKAVASKKGSGRPVNAAMTFPGGTHDLWLRYWMSAGGLDPVKDISTIVVPPPQMVANMKVGNMDAFCVGEPWNEQLKNQKIGYTALTTGELWAKHPEKAFSMRTDFVEKYPKATRAILMAIMEAQMFCEKMENKDEIAKIAADRKWIGAPVADITDRYKGKIDYGTGRVVDDSPHKMKFWADFASYPFKSHDSWFLTENIRWGYLPSSTDTKALVDKVNREDIWRECAKAMNIPANEIPATSSRGIETFFDGKTFDPEKPQAYLDSLAIKYLAS